MRPTFYFAFAAALLAGCDPDCRAGEMRVANDCYPRRQSNADGGGSIDPAGARAGQGDSSVEADAGNGSSNADAALGPTVDGGFSPGNVSDAPTASDRGPVREDERGSGPDAAVAPPIALVPVEPGCVSSAETCDGKDNDCDGVVDDGLANECGGPCTTSVGSAIGSPCKSNGTGACATQGTYQCVGATTACNAQVIAPAAEICDAIDNDCDGMIDESAPTWFQDCDGDGYAASTLAAVTSCTKPAPSSATCASWTTTIPAPDTHSNWDCNDADPAYKPGADYGFPPTGSTSYDLNCDGQATPSPTYVESNRRIPRCTLSQVEEHNKNDCTTPGARCDCSMIGAMCHAWRDSAGKFVTRPTSYCPDYPSFLRAFPAGDFGGVTTCGASLTMEAGTNFPCR